MSVSHADALAERIGIDARRLYGIIGVSERTAARKKADNKPLDPEQSDVLARIARIVGLAEDVLESPQAAHRWLDKPNRVLGAAPLSLLDTDIGTEQVEEVLMRIQYGIYS